MMNFFSFFQPSIILPLRSSTWSLCRLPTLMASGSASSFSSTSSLSLSSSSSPPTRPSFSSLDENEVKKFSQLSEEWWDPNGKMKPLHQINPLRTSYIRDQLCVQFNRDSSTPLPLSGLNILDIGCGVGLASESFAKMGASVTGIDASESNIRVAINHLQPDPWFQDHSDYKPVYLCGTPEEIFAGKKTDFDAVVSLEVIEHVANPEMFLTTCANLVNTNGSLILSTINKTFSSYLLAIVGAEYVLRWLPIGTHQWSKFLQPSQLESMVGAKCKTLDLKGITFNPFFQRWSLSDDLSVNYMIHFVKTLA